VVNAVRRLEDDPLFNAGTGSKLQVDGRARLSAAAMDGEEERFGGVVNVEGLLNPVLLARALMDDDDRVLAGAGALERARQLGLPEGEVRTAERVAEWQARTGGPAMSVAGACDSLAGPCDPPAGPADPLAGRTGTVGAVARDDQGHMAAATSTGGRGLEAVGRVSDTPTVAATYANAHAAVSLTGVGEDIVDGALGARLVTLVEAGQPLERARQHLRAACRRRGWQAGFIAVDASGAWVVEHSTPAMSWWMAGPDGTAGFLD